jgi:threonine 3-dehydrogenase
MLALRKVERAVDGLSLDEIESPGPPPPGYAKIKVNKVGICGTDLAIFNWVPFLRHMKVPIVLGHEISGIVEAVGDGVDRVKVGDFVSVESHIPCGRCYNCLRGFSHVCENTRYPGIHIDGGFAAYTNLPEQILWVVDRDVPADIAAMFEPFGIAVHAAMDGIGVAGMNVVIAGCGPIGLMTIMAARALGANTIVATDRNTMRLGEAAKCGANFCINVDVGDLKTEILHALPNGPDVFLDFSAAAESIQTASDVVAGGGEIRLIGSPAGTIELNIERWLHRGLTVRGLHGRRLFATWVHAMRLVKDRRVDLKPLISHVLPLKEARYGFGEALAGRTLKVLIDPA